MQEVEALGSLSNHTQAVVRARRAQGVVDGLWVVRALEGPGVVGGEWMWGMEAPARRPEVGHLEASRWTEATLGDAILSKLGLSFEKSPSATSPPWGCQKIV